MAAERDFLNINDLRDYPLIHGDDFSITGGELPRKGLTDAGFMLGLDSEFLAGIHTVTLFSVRVTVSSTEFDFRSDAPGMAGYRWLFVFTDDASFGCTAREDAVSLSTGLPDPDRGWGFLTLGDSVDVRALGVGLFSLITPPRVETALLQSLLNTFARSVSVANDPRRCPDLCCPSSSSSSSSSGTASNVFLHTSGLIGDVKLTEGINALVQVNDTENAIDIEGVLGGGIGPNCEDIIIDENGFQRGEDCVNCDGLAKSINGRSTINGKLKLKGGPGIVFVADPGNNRIVAKVEGEYLCVPSSSSSL